MKEPFNKINRNYNTAALMGQDITDLEVCQDLGLDPSLANTPAINLAALKAIRQRNINDGVRGGLSEENAIKNANKQFNDAKKLSDTLVSKIK